MTSRNNIYLYTKNDTDSLRRKELLQKVIHQHGFKAVDNFEEASIIVSIGSDATFLQAVRKNRVSSGHSLRRNLYN